MGRLNELFVDWKEGQKERDELLKVEIPAEISRHGQELTLRI